jgi:SAM-dependent methyltransferase
MKSLAQSVARSLLPPSVCALLPLEWQEALCRLTGSRPKFMPPPQDGKVRLNLGSGDLSLPGYLNVDQASERGGHHPDIISDIRKLDLPACHADEILAIHVLEHFYLWEVDDVLAEWRRVLKPGGRLVIELPDLIKCARNLLKAPDIANPDQWKLNMFGLYGDQNWREPIMTHKWGWTRQLLESKLKQCGFTEIRHELPLFHRVSRDARVVSRKPFQ